MGLQSVKKKKRKKRHCHWSPPKDMDRKSQTSLKDLSSPLKSVHNNTYPGCHKNFPHLRKGGWKSKFLISSLQDYNPYQVLLVSKGFDLNRVDSWTYYTQIKVRKYGSSRDAFAKAIQQKQGLILQQKERGR